MGDMEITNLAVKPEFQSKKIASALMEQIKDFSGTIFLEVRENLYQKYNFEKFHTRKNYYSHPTEDAILMRKIQ